MDSPLLVSHLSKIPVAVIRSLLAQRSTYESLKEFGTHIHDELLYSDHSMKKHLHGVVIKIIFLQRTSLPVYFHLESAGKTWYRKLNNLQILQRKRNRASILAISFLGCQYTASVHASALPGKCTRRAHSGVTTNGNIALLANPFLALTSQRRLKQLGYILPPQVFEGKPRNHGWRYAIPGSSETCPICQSKTDS